MLHSGWITEKHIDFEYKSFQLLGYLKRVSDSFKENKLFPYLPDLVSHRKNLLHLKNEKLNLAEKFPRELKKIDLKRQRLEYSRPIEDDRIMSEIHSIVEYALPKFELCLEEGNSIYSFVKEKLNIFPVGVIPIYTNEGYMLLSRFNTGRKKVAVFQYSVSLFINETSNALLLPEEVLDELYCNIHTRYVTSVTVTAVNTFENIKIQLMRDNPELPNPATFAVESELSFPLNETLLPVAKKLLVNYIITQPAVKRPNN